MPDKSTDNVGLALSGGGVRALLFGLGALRAVVAARDQRPGSKLSVLIGVSGGALAAAYAASRTDISRVNLADYDEHVLRPATWSITNRALMFSDWSVWAVFAGTLGAIIAGAGVAVFGRLSWPFRIGFALLGVVAASLPFHQRGAAIERSMKNALFENDQPISSIQGDTHLILQATDLASAEATYLTSQFVKSWRWGEAPSGDLSLIHAARAATTFPVVFGPLRLKSPPFRDGHGPPPPPKTLSLVDGGIYDNMGSEWLIQHTCDEVCRIVVNASRNLPPRDGLYGIPIIGDILVLLRERDIQYDATTAPRRRLHHRMTEHSPGGGTTVAIDGNLHDWVRKFTRTNDDRGRRATAVLEKMSRVKEPGVWARWKDSNSAVPTSLGKLSLATARDLVCAGYLSTAIQMHVLRGWPAPESVDPAELMPWLGER